MLPKTMTTNKETMMRTMKEVYSYLRHEGVSGVLVRRIERMSEQFATPEMFFSASKGDIMRAHQKSNPKAEYGLGNSFWRVFGKASAYFSSDEADEVSKSETCDKEAQETNGIADGMLRLIPLEDLKTVVSFMELCDVEAINLVEIVGFLGAVRIRQKKAEKPEASDGQPENIDGGDHK